MLIDNLLGKNIRCKEKQQQCIVASKEVGLEVDPKTEYMIIPYE
jgi:hypothetical protein